MLQYVLAQRTGGAGSDPGAARLTDPRFAAIDKVNLRTRYGAPLDGLSHPMTMAAALAAYPLCGATGTIEQDTAAWLQAEAEMRAGWGGIIYLPDGAYMFASQTLALQNAAKVWFHAGRGCVVNAAGCGTTPGIRVSNGNSGQYINPLHGINLVASASIPSPSTTGAGTPYTGYVPGAVAIAIDNTIGADFTSITWAGFDRPFKWGDNTFGIAFRNWTGGANNVGFNWDQTVGLNSMERVRLIGGNAANNNIGVDIKAYFGNNSQGGSIFIDDCGMDYNIVRALQFNGLPSGNYNSQNGLHVTRCHIETTGACSGTTPRMHIQGTAFFTDNEFYESDATKPTGFIEIEAFSAGTAISNRLDVDRLPVFITGTTSTYVRIEGYGNVGQNPNQPIYILKAQDGTFLQRSLMDRMAIQVKLDPAPMRIEQYNNEFYLGYDNAGDFTIPTNDQANIPIGTVIRFVNFGPPVRFVSGPNVIYNPANNAARTLPTGGTASIWKYDTNNWMLTGVGLYA